MGMGTRQKRIKRLRAIFPVLEEMEEYAEQIRGDSMFTPDEYPDGEDLWLPTPFTHSRDSELQEECNWDVITEAFQEKCPEGYKEPRFGHWGWGWSERVYVRKDNAAAIQLTQEFVNALHDSAVLDTKRLSEAESERLNEYLESELGGYPGEDDDEYIGRVREYLREHHDVHTLEDVSQDEIKDARLNVKHPYDRWDYGDGEECYFCEQEQSNPVHDMTSVDLEAGGQLRLPEQP